MPAAQTKDDSDIHFFSTVDMSKEGRINAEYPSWYFDNQRDELEEDIRILERQINSKVHENTTELRENLRRKKGQLDAINEATPKLTAAKKDKMAKVREELGAKIADALYSRNQRKLGFEDIAEERRRMMDPCMDLSPEMREFAAASNVPMKDGRFVSRSGAEKMWKIMGKALGDTTDVETLRRKRHGYEED